MTHFVRTFTDFMAAVKTADFEAVSERGDDEARNRIKDALDGVDLYFHGGPNMGEGYTWLTLADLIAYRFVERVTLHKNE